MRNNGSNKPETDPLKVKQEGSVLHIENPEKPLEQANVTHVTSEDADQGRDGQSPTLEDAVLDPDNAERIRNTVGGKWVDPSEPIPKDATVWDYQRKAEQLGIPAHHDDERRP